MRRLKVGLLLALASVAQGSDISWMQVSAQLTYTDATKSCTQEDSLFNRIYLTLEIENSRVLRAKFKVGSASMPFREVEFQPEEIAGIRLKTDPHRRYWLDQLPLSERLLLWGVRYWDGYQCQVPQSLSTVDGAPISFPFVTAGVGEESLLNLSSSQEFTGKRKDGEPYRMSVRLYQRPFQVGY